VVALWAPPPYAADSIFDPDSRGNRDDCLIGFRRLQERIRTDYGGLCHTADVLAQSRVSPDVVLFLEIPAEPIADLLAHWPAARPWVILFESEVVVPRNWKYELHGQFEQIFTWADDIVDDNRYHKINYANPWPTLPLERDRPAGFGAMIAANKASRHPLELYSARREVIRWYERHHPDLFDLYGIGWEQPGPGEPVKDLVSRLTRRFAADRPSFPAWRGPVESKLPTLSQYRFGVAFENSRDIVGYITEKPFDCMFAGSVPIYWGAPNMTDHVPTGCFVDRTAFGGWDELHEHLVTMDEDTYRSHLDAIDDFLASERAYLFTADYFADQICRVLQQSPATAGPPTRTEGATEGRVSRSSDR
jgi:hypothetical protein